MYNDSTQKINGVTYDVVAEGGQSDMYYEWHDAAILRDPDGALFYVSGQGCSCNWLWDELGKEDLVPIGSLHDGVALFQSEFSDSDSVEFAQRVLF